MQSELILTISVFLLKNIGKAICHVAISHIAQSLINSRLTSALITDTKLQIAQWQLCCLLLQSPQMDRLKIQNTSSSKKTLVKGFAV